ncbi:hypothetical protein ACJX0J_019347, partial [Zea mays]
HGQFLCGQCDGLDAPRLHRRRPRMGYDWVGGVHPRHPARIPEKDQPHRAAALLLHGRSWHARAHCVRLLLRGREAEEGRLRVRLGGVRRRRATRRAARQDRRLLRRPPQDQVRLRRRVQLQ